MQNLCRAGNGLFPGHGQEVAQDTNVHTIPPFCLRILDFYHIFQVYYSILDRYLLFFRFSVTPFSCQEVRAMPRQNPQALLQNLQDTGRGGGLITQFLTLYQAGQYPQSLALLAQHRRTLLQSTAMRQSEGSPA